MPSKGAQGEDDFMSWLMGIFGGDCTPNRKNFKRSETPGMFEPPSGAKGKPVVQQVIEVDTSIFKTIPKPKDADLKSSYHAITTKAELQVARTASHQVYDKEVSIAKKTMEDFEQTFGDEATELIKAIFDRHKVEDPMSVPQDAQPQVWEERWFLDRDSRDVEGEQMVHKLGDIIRGINRERAIAGDDQLLFTDPHFPPELSSIFADVKTAGQNANAQSTFRTDQDAFLTGVDVNGIQWKRPSEFGDPNERPVIYSGDIDPNDVAQGALGNCYFLAAIASCTVDGEDFLIKDLCIEENGDVGVYAVKFFFNAKWRTVVVDDLIPCVNRGGTWQPLFAAPKQHSKQEAGTKELWALIFEKAWAKLHLSYEVTDAGMTGDTTSYLTGGSVKQVKLSMNIEDSDQEREWQELSKLCENPSSLAFLSASIRADIPIDPTTLLNSYGLMSGHAYSILDLRKVSNGERLVHVRNPWGHTEWKGRYSDNSREWTDTLRRELGHRAETDGAFYMCWQDFLYFFGILEVCDPASICRLTEDGAARIDVYEGNWIKGKTAGGPDGAKTFKYNPTCVLKVARSGPVEIAMYQPDTRPTCTVSEIQKIPIELWLVDKTRGIAKQKVIETSSRMGCYLMQRAEANHEYHLIAAAVNPGVESKFWITASGNGCTLSPLASPEAAGTDAALMNCDNSRQMCCVVCRGEDPEGYYPTAEGYKCESCYRARKPVPLNRSAASPTSPAPAAEVQADKCAHCSKELHGGCQKINGSTYCFPPCWRAPPQCYYCREVIRSTYSETQYGPLCNPCGRRFGCV